MHENHYTKKKKSEPSSQPFLHQIVNAQNYLLTPVALAQQAHT